MRSQKTRALAKRDAKVRFRAVRVVLLVLLYNGAFALDSFRFRPVHYPRRWTKVIPSSISFCFYCAVLGFWCILLEQADSSTARFLICCNLSCNLPRILKRSCNSASSVIVNCLHRIWIYLSCERLPVTPYVLLENYINK